MNIKTVAAAVAMGAVCALAPTLSTAGGELQAYERPYTGYSQATYQSSYAGYGGGYGAPMPASYARPASMYGGYGCGPCASMPYGYSMGHPGLFGNDIFTAGLLGVGIGYLIFH